MHNEILKSQVQREPVAILSGRNLLFCGSLYSIRLWKLPHILYCMILLFLTYNLLSSGFFSAHDVSASTHVTSPGSSCAFSSVLSLPWPCFPLSLDATLLTVLARMPLLWEKTSNILNLSSEYSFQLLSSTESWLSQEDLSSLTAFSLLNISTYYFRLMTPSSLCEIFSFSQAGANPLPTLSIALRHYILGLPLLTYSCIPTLAVPQLHSVLQSIYLHCLLSPPWHFTVLTSLYPV